MERPQSFECEVFIQRNIKNIAYEFFKRVIDVIGSLIGLVILFPLFVIVAIAIRIDSKGPIFFSQNRCCINGKTFKMYKFRSMIKDADSMKLALLRKNEMTGPVFKIKSDPRITQIGRFIRRTSIDELPQLVNVLKGEMSLVGPRPPLLCEVEKYNTYQMQRLLVKPGLTCYWQTMGRNNINFDKWVELDIKYIQERNTLTDIKLILKTFVILFGDKNAF